MIQPVILCGGAGTRLWPISTPERPKPFLKLIGERTLFQQALDRVADPERFASPLVVAGEGHVDFISQQAGDHRLIVEPAARNTAPAIALAAARLDPEAVMLVCPSDHYIADESSFATAAGQAAQLAGEGWLVSIGIEPTRPETGYGYIQRGEALGEGHRVARFVEKPDLERAREFLADGGFVWNAGIFAFQAGTFLEELARYRPDMAGAVREAVRQGLDEGHRFYPAAQPFEAIQGESVDYAIMENTDHAAVVAAEMGWSDIGNWDALMSARRADAQGNVCGPDARLLDSSGVMTQSDGPRISVVGLENVIVVVEDGEVLVISRDAVQQVSKLSEGGQ